MLTESGAKRLFHRDASDRISRSLAEGSAASKRTASTFAPRLGGFATIRFAIGKYSEWTS